MVHGISTTFGPAALFVGHGLRRVSASSEVGCPAFTCDPRGIKHEDLAFGDPVF